MLGSKWSLLILHHLAAGPRRFGELRRQLPDISEKVLVQELKQLVMADLLVHTNHGEVPPRVEYHLTPLGRHALPVLGRDGGIRPTLRGAYSGRTPRRGRRVAAAPRQ